MPDDSRREPIVQWPEMRPTLDEYDRLMGNLEGLPDVTATKPTTVRTTVPILGSAQTWIVQTFRQRDQQHETAKARDTIFLEGVNRTGSLRLAIPPAVADAIARQRDALTARVRSKAAKAAAADRKARGIVPGFLKSKRARKSDGPVTDGSQRIPKGAKTR